MSRRSRHGDGDLDSPRSTGDALAAVRRALDSAQVEYGRVARAEAVESRELRAARSDLEQAQRYIAWLAEQLADVETGTGASERSLREEKRRVAELQEALEEAGEALTEKDAKDDAVIKALQEALKNEKARIKELQDLIEDTGEENAEIKKRYRELDEEYDERSKQYVETVEDLFEVRERSAVLERNLARKNAELLADRERFIKTRRWYHYTIAAVIVAAVIFVLAFIYIHY